MRYATLIAILCLVVGCIEGQREECPEIGCEVDIKIPESVRCRRECEKAGYELSNVAKAGECLHIGLNETGCVFHCSYRRISHSVGEGNVCCCRKLVTIECPFNRSCECPNREEAETMCREKKSSG